MTNPRDAIAVTLPSLADADWLNWPATRAVLDALARAGHEGRIVGGAVRNTLMGRPAADIDIATPARPEEVVAAAEAAGLQAVPTGLAHGTITVVADHKPIEVTTLRRDVATDGRRATVAFTADWALDAWRRDFTINAMYCDGQGHLYDPVGGYQDVLARRVRFIGDADKRISEDYLRILRFFRFHAAYATGAPNREGMAACARGLGGLARLSAERIRSELMRLLVAPGVGSAVAAMTDIGLVARVLGTAPRPGVLARLLAAEAALELPADAVLRLSALALAVDEDLPRLAERLRLSRAEQAGLLVLEARLVAGLGDVDARGARALVYRHGREGAQRRLLALASVAPDRLPSVEAALRSVAHWPVPKLPVQGGDLLARGVAAGPKVGALLADLEAWWIEQDFPPDTVVLAELDRRLSQPA